jgi:hypothetical protein
MHTSSEAIRKSLARFPILLHKAKASGALVSDLRIRSVRMALAEKLRQVADRA